MLSSVELLNVMDFGKVVKNELSFLFTTRTIMVQVLTGYLLFSFIYSGAPAREARQRSTMGKEIW